MRLPAFLLATGVAFAASAAQANDFPIDRWQACAPKLQKLTAKDYPGTVYATPLSGGTGIFVVRKFDSHAAVGVTGEAIKFLRYPDPGVEYARNVLAKMHLPHDNLIAYTEDVEEVTAARDLVVKASTDNKFRNVSPDLLATRISRITMAADGAAGVPPAMLLTRLVPLAGEGETLAAMLSGVDVNPSNHDRKVEDLLLAVRALKDPANQQFLGALFIADLMLGNGDRMSKGTGGNGSGIGPNWNNIVVGAAPNATSAPCLVAIDNEAVAPSPTQVLFDRAASSNPHGGANIAVAMTADELLDALIRRHVEDGQETYGPGVAFEAPLLNDGVGLCRRPRDIAPGVVSDAQLGRIVNSLRDAIRTGVTTMGMSLIDSPQRPGCAMFVRFEQDDTLKEQGIDWGEFESNFNQGVAYAVKHFTKDEPKSTVRAAAQLSNEFYRGLDRLSREAMSARIEFLKHIMAGAPHARSTADALIAMKSNTKLRKEKFMQQQAHTFGSIYNEAAWGRLLHD